MRITNEQLKNYRTPDRSILIKYPEVDGKNVAIICEEKFPSTMGMKGRNFHYHIPVGHDTPKDLNSMYVASQLLGINILPFVDRIDGEECVIKTPTIRIDFYQTEDPRAPYGTSERLNEIIISGRGYNPNELVSDSNAVHYRFTKESIIRMSEDAQVLWALAMYLGWEPAELFRGHSVFASAIELKGE